MTSYQVKCPCGTVLTVSAEQASDAFVCPRCARKLAFTQPAQRPAPVATRADSGPARWLLARNKQRLGPYTSAQLKQFADAGQLQPEDMILRQGRQKWVSAGTVKGLFTAAPPAPIAPPEPQLVLEPFGDFTMPAVARTTRPPRPRIGRRWLAVAGGAGVAVAAIVVALVLWINRGPRQPAANAGDANGSAESGQKKLDLSYIAADFNAAVIVHPGRILERPFLAKLLEDKSLAEFIKEVGVDPRKVDQVIVLVDPFPGGNVAAMPAFIVRFSEPVDGAAVVTKTLEGAEKATFEGKEYFRGKGATLAHEKDCACVADDRTILAAAEPTLKKMLTAKDARSPLLDRLPRVDLNHDVIVAFVMDQTKREAGQGPMVRKALDEVLKQAKDNLPPNLEGADKLAEQVAAATVTFDLGGETVLSLDVEAVDEKAAATVHELAKNSLDLVRVGVPAFKKEIKKGLPPDLSDVVSSLVEELVNGLTLNKEGSHVTLALKMPSKLPELVEKLGPMLKELGARQPPPPPGQRKDGSPRKDRPAVKDRKKN